MDYKIVLDKYNLEQKNRMNTDNLKKYNMHIKRFFTFIDQPIERITTADVEKWITFLKSMGYSNSNIRQHYFGLLSFIIYCIEKDIIFNNPCKGIAIPRKEFFTPLTISDKDFISLMEAAVGQLRDQAILQTFYHTGLRVSELANLKIEHINFRSRVLLVLKGKNEKDREVPISQICSLRINNYLDIRHDTSPYLFKSKKRDHLSRRQIHWLVKKYVDKAGLDPQISPHTFRYTYATMLIEKGFQVNEISHLLGHESLDTTNMYINMCTATKKKKYDLYYI
jgi:site-specific recombinase XerD